MRHAITETSRRRELQDLYNRNHGITPATIQSKIKEIGGSVYGQDYTGVGLAAAEESIPYTSLAALRQEIKVLTKEMHEAAAELAFEEAAELRDRIKILQEQELKWL